MKTSICRCREEVENEEMSSAAQGVHFWNMTVHVGQQHTL